ncbi:hypothetical protein ZIOFF_054714 [Zingiber officinale]|uniref:CID domain-containing protein n=1 Tax=Zingiber officinale TaxID=94328 RepID=A0A8J5FDY9_ZINOF|nr:hypothetical protein ZIOFF_054714 [Zingiber officinale]
MESSRRSVMDRSRELGMKRARLAVDDAGDRDRISLNRDRSLPPSRANGQPWDPRPPRPGEREDRDDAPRAGSHRELVAQYKTALAELIFNSKPIITNLTIIAGESLHAAKEIAAVICTNVLEVPCEQKLPSLYLLDSIVKNIGRDYIKYFAARLPEVVPVVFCKVYKQVESSIHPSMRHLFGTWKGVFPLATLQVIEKELGFSPVINGSSGSASSKPDSQFQRPAHSIHVNPKYLEARQRLQQSSRAKDVNNDELSGVPSTFGDTHKSDRNPVLDNSRQWTSLPSKNMERPQQERVNSAAHGTKVIKLARDYEYSSDFPQEPDLGIGRLTGRLKDHDGHDRLFYGAGVAATEAQHTRRNEFDVKQSYGVSHVLGSKQASIRLSSLDSGGMERKKLEATGCWKNAEEEEFVWDDIKTRMDLGGTNSSVKGGRSTGETKKLTNLQRGKWPSLETDHVESNSNKVNASQYNTSKGGNRLPSYEESVKHVRPPGAEHEIDSGLNMDTSDLLLNQRTSPQHSSSLWLRNELTPADAGLNYKRSKGDQVEGHLGTSGGGLPTSINSALPLHGVRPSALSSSLNTRANLPVPVGSISKQRHQPSEHPSPYFYLPPSSEPIQQLKPLNAVDQNHLRALPFTQMSEKSLHMEGKMNKIHVPGSLDASSAKNHAQPFVSLSNSARSLSETSQQLEGSLDSATSASFNQPHDHLRFLEQSKHNLSKQQPEAQPLSKAQYQPSHQMEKLPPLSLGHEATHTGTETSLNHSNTSTAEALGQPSASSLLAAIMNSGLLSNNSLTTFPKLNVEPPLPIGPPPIQISTLAPLSTSSSSSLSDNLSNLNSSHFGETMPPLPPGPPPSSSLAGMNSENPETSGHSLNPLSSLLSSLVAKGLISSRSTELPSASAAELANKVGHQCVGSANNCTEQINSSTSVVPSIVSQSNAINENEILGIEFKQEILRQPYPSVIRSLFVDLKHQCCICGTRFRFQEQLKGHLDWHVSKESEISDLRQKSRKWFLDMNSSHTAVLPSAATALLDEMDPCEEDCGSMVPADESQSICALCGEPFEDFYSEVRDEWMYKGTTYLDQPYMQDDASKVADTAGQLIVHAGCIAQRSCDNMDITEHDKVEQL